MPNEPFGARGMAQVIEQLPIECEALRSNLSTKLKKKKKNTHTLLAFSMKMPEPAEKRPGVL
jgi:hypothetical protein